MSKRGRPRKCEGAVYEREDSKFCRSGTGTRKEKYNENRRAPPIDRRPSVFCAIAWTHETRAVSQLSWTANI